METFLPLKHKQKPRQKKKNVMRNRLLKKQRKERMLPSRMVDLPK
jgi:hypothetical protein